MSPGVVTYRPEPSIGLFVGCTVAAIALGVLLLTGVGQQFVSLEFGSALLLAWPLSLVFLWSGRKRLILSRDEPLGCLRIELRRWPLASIVTTHPLAELRDAIVEVDPMGETATHRVALVLASGAKVPLTESFCSKHARHEQAAREIRALLG